MSINHNPSRAAMQAVFDSAPVMDAAKPNMDDALAMLRKLVKGGMEFPDAQSKVSLKFKLSAKQGDKLRDMYDEESAMDGVGYDKAKQAVFAKATVPDGYNGDTAEVGLAVVDGEVWEVTSKGSHRAGIKAESADDAMKKVMSNKRYSKVKKA